MMWTVMYSSPPYGFECTSFEDRRVAAWRTIYGGAGNGHWPIGAMEALYRVFIWSDPWDAQRRHGWI